MICVLTGPNKTIKLLPLIVNSLNANLQSFSINLLFNPETTNHFVCNKNLFMKKTYKEETSYFEIGLWERILFEGIELVQVPLQNKNRCQTNLVFT